MQDDAVEIDFFDHFEKGVDECLEHYKKLRLPSRFLVDLYNEEPSEKLELFLAQYMETPSVVLAEILSTTESEEVLVACAGHPRLPAEAMSVLLEHSSEALRINLASNKQLSPAAAESLLADSSPLVRVKLLENSTIPSRLLGRLILDSSPLVRQKFIEKKDLSEDFLKILENDDLLALSLQTVYKAKVSEDKQVEWADSNDEAKQLALLQRRRLDFNSLDSMAFADSENVRLQCLMKKDLEDDELLSWALQGSSAVKAHVATRNNLFREVQDILLESSDEEVLLNLADNPIFIDELALKLAETCSLEVAAVLLTKKSLFSALCSVFSKRDFVEVQLEILGLKEEKPDEFYMDLLAKNDRRLDYVMAKNNLAVDLLTSEKIELLLKERLPVFKQWIAKSEILDEAQMEALLAVESDEVRLALAGNARVPLRFLELLAGVKSKAVVKVAQARIAEKEAYFSGIREAEADEAQSPFSTIEMTAEEIRKMENFQRDEGLIAKILNTKPID